MITKTQFMRTIYQLLFALFFLSPLLTNAQIKKGMHSHQLFFQPSFDFEESSQVLSVPLQYSFAAMVSDHFMIGGSLAAVGELYQGNVVGGIALGPAIRYYINPASQRNNYFVGADAIFGGSSFDEIIISQDGIADAFNFNVGLNRFLNPNVSLEARANYSLRTDAFAPDVFSIDLGLRLFMDQEAREGHRTAVGTFEEGTVLLGVSNAQISFTSEVYDMSLAPNAAYFLNDRLAVGVGLNARIAAVRGNDNNTSFLSIAPFTRYYFTSAGHVRWFGQVGAGIGLSTTNIVSLSEELKIKSTTYQMNARFGSNIFLTPHLALELSIGPSYFYGESTTNNDQFPKSIDRSIRLVGEIGFQFFLDNFIRSED